MLTYILLDAARPKADMYKAKELNSNHSSLYREQIEKNLGDVAPYLFTFPLKSEFSKWFIEKCWGGACGVLVSSKFSFEEIYKHFQKFLLVKTEDGKELYFRFYDPRVLRIFLPTCDKQQITEFFGPIDYFTTEGETKEEAIVFKQKNGELTEERVPASKVFGEPVEKIPLVTKETKEPEEAQEGKRPPRRFIY